MIVLLIYLACVTITYFIGKLILQTWFCDGWDRVMTVLTILTSIVPFLGLLAPVVVCLVVTSEKEEKLKL